MQDSVVPPSNAADYAGVIRWARERLDIAVRRRGDFATPYDLPANVLKRCAYTYVRVMLAKPDQGRGALAGLEAYVRHEHGDHAKATDSPFIWALRLLKSLPPAQAAPDRSKFAVQLQYAHLHNIAPSNLVPFLMSAGGYEIIRSKLHANHRELWAKGLEAVPTPRRTKQINRAASPTERDIPDAAESRTKRRDNAKPQHQTERRRKSSK